jgi:uncharacterized protein YrrD
MESFVMIEYDKPTRDSENHESDFADDKLDGLKAIAEFTGDTKRVAAYRISNGTYPAYRSGKKIISSKSAIMARRDKLLAANKK